MVGLTSLQAPATRRHRDATRTIFGREERRPKTVHTSYHHPYHDELLASLAQLHAVGDFCIIGFGDAFPAFLCGLRTNVYHLTFGKG